MDYVNKSHWKSPIHTWLTLCLEFNEVKFLLIFVSNKFWWPIIALDRDEWGNRPLKVLKIKNWRVLGVVSVSWGYALYVVRTYLYKFELWLLQVVKIDIPTMINLWIRYGHGLIMCQLNELLFFILCVLHFWVVGRVI